MGIFTYWLPACEIYFFVVLHVFCCWRQNKYTFYTHSMALWCSNHRYGTNNDITWPNVMYLVDRIVCYTSPRRRKWQVIASGIVRSATVNGMLLNGLLSGACRQYCSSSWRGCYTTPVISYISSWNIVIVCWTHILIITAGGNWTKLNHIYYLVWRLTWQAPQYLADCCTPVTDVVGRQRLRSATQQLMVVPQHRMSTVGRRAYAVHGPMVWNSLPDDLRAQQDYELFRQGLKTWLFSRY